MSMTNVRRIDARRVAPFAEVGVYALAASLLLGKIFYTPTPFTTQDSLAILGGEVFGLMAACAASPLCAAWAWWRDNRSPVVKKVFETTATILPFNRRNGLSGRRDSGDDGRRAA